MIPIIWIRYGFGLTQGVIEERWDMCRCSACQHIEQTEDNEYRCKALYQDLDEHSCFTSKEDK